MSQEELRSLEAKAMNGDEMPSGLGYPEQILYLSFEKLYWLLKRGGISRPDATKAKAELMEQYRLNKFREEMGEEWVAVIKATELARSAFRKEPTIENAMKLVEILEGRKRSELPVPV